MDVVAVAIPRPDLFHPIPILWSFYSAEFFLDHRANEDALYVPILGGNFDKREIGRCPSARVEMSSIRRNDAGHRYGICLATAKRLRRHGAEPNVHV
jgi:hypothetical protein